MRQRIRSVGEYAVGVVVLIAILLAVAFGCSALLAGLRPMY